MFPRSCRNTHIRPLIALRKTRAELPPGVLPAIEPFSLPFRSTIRTSSQISFMRRAKIHDYRGGLRGKAVITPFGWNARYRADGYLQFVPST